MSNSTSAKREYFNWIASLDRETLEDYEKKLLNVLVANFDEIYNLGTAGGQRAKKLGQIIEKTGSTQGTDIPVNVTLSGSKSDFVKTICEMKIGPFRGFNIEETFIFDKKYTFMYGPNGSGKSSFCEGLEYALLGGIEESQAKRITIANYIKNAQSGTGQRPIIYGIKEDNSKYEVTENQSAYRFSFIEKNRIEAFARISATTPKDQLTRISSLFGLDSFNDFVNGFTDEFDDRYIKLVNSKQTEFDEESKKQETSKTRLIEIDEMIAKIPEEVKPLIEEIGNNQIKDITILIKYLSGEDGSSGIIGELQQTKAEYIMPDLDIKIVDRLKETYGILNENISSLERQHAKFAESSSEVNFKDLYSALSSIGMDSTTDKTRCPACKTPIKDTLVNPFENAQLDLMKMERLGTLQDDITNLCIEISELVRKLNIEIAQLISFKNAVADNSPHLIQLTEFSFTDISGIAHWKDQLSLELAKITESFSSLVHTATLIISHNEKLKNKREIKANVDSQLQKNLTIKSKADNILVRLKVLNDERVRINKSINDFQTQNEGVIKKIAEIQNVIRINSLYKTAYDSLLHKLKEFRDKLPIQLASGLSEKTLTYYNIINDHDPAFEKLKSLQLPTTQSEKILVQFVGDSRTHVLFKSLVKDILRRLGYLCYWQKLFLMTWVS